VQVSIIICLFTKIVGCVKWLTADEQYRIRVRTTNPHHTVDRNGVHLKFTTFSCIKLKTLYFAVIFIEDIRSCYANKQ